MWNPAYKLAGGCQRSTSTSKWSKQIEIAACDSGDKTTNYWNTKHPEVTGHHEECPVVNTGLLQQTPKYRLHTGRCSIITQCNARIKSCKLFTAVLSAGSGWIKFSGWHSLIWKDNFFFFVLFSTSIRQEALFSISLLNSDNPQASGISQGTKPDLGVAQTV